MHTTYLPAIANDRKPDKARQLFDLICGHPAQCRPVIQWNDLLARVATAHCRDMAQRNYFGHTNPDHVNANQRLRNAGYRLPDLYSEDGNNVESLAAGDPTVGGTLRAWLNSPGHRPHVFGEGDFWGSQTQGAVGYAEGGYYKRYWCALFCHGDV